ncbi:ATPase [Halobacteriaceae bacterium SHR40]|uniref:ATPase n=1 Tax=Halovenus amylolytica TaxID=2500550 RepID=UPI000FE34966
MTLLVVGADRVDAGKTTFSTGLVAATGAVGFKPRAGNDYWFHHDDYRTAISEGSIYGKDARRLAAASPGSLEPTDINPVHRLWRPAPGNGTGLLGQDEREFLLDRVGEQYVRNGNATLPEDARSELPLSDALVVSSVEEFNQVMQRHHVQQLDALSATIDRTERAVVESYSDVARPLQGIDPDGVAVVEPGRTRIFDGPRFVKGCQVASGAEGAFHGQLEERVASVTELVDPVDTITLPALGRDERNEPGTVADAYGAAYRSLLDVAGW